MRHRTSRSPARHVSPPANRPRQRWRAVVKRWHLSCAQEGKMVEGFAAKFRRAWARRGSGPALRLIASGTNVIAQMATAPIHLRSCTVGRRVRTMGAPHVTNEGHIEIGDDVLLASRWNAVELSTGPSGRIRIGRGTHINFGTTISAQKLVTIGERVQIGQYGIIWDTEVPRGGKLVDDGACIEIADGAWLAGRVTVLPGARIGAGSVITAGSVVAGEIPPGVVAGGIPARVLRSVDGPPLARAATRAEDPASATTAAESRPLARGTLIADFTVDGLNRFLGDSADGMPLLADTAPFAQVAQVLLEGPRPGCADFALVWTRPETAVPSFARLVACEPVAEATLVAEVDAFCALVVGGARGWRQILVPTWSVPAERRGLGVIDARPGGVARALAAMNLRLMDRLGETRNVLVLDAQRWVAAAGRPQNPRAWYMGKVAFGDPVLAEAARDVKAAVAALAGATRKLVVLDLDDTLWGGIVGDVGWEALRLGGHDAVGEAFVEFQRRLKALTRRGIILAVVSKNEEATALEAIRSHPEMVLRDDDFVAWRINWQDKARNISEIIAELNLGLHSVVFIDDNPVERGRVREALPEVLVPDWPEDKLLYPSALSELRCFDILSVSAEDTERTRLYASERQREQMRKEVGSIDSWLESLDIRVRAEPVAGANLARTSQLLNKTNQMNLATRRMTEQEILAWTREPGHWMWVLTVSDRFGDAGLTGIVSVAADAGVARVVDYALSCRVMGRKVEETMIHLAVETARAAGMTSVEARLLPTKKNRPCLDFWRRSGFALADPELFRWDAVAAYALPSCIHLEWQRVQG
jgi:FkbH-like protein